MRKVFCVSALLCISAGAFANFLEYTGMGLTRTGSINGHIGANTYNHSNVYFGQIQVKEKVLVGDSFGPAFNTYCISPSTNLASSWQATPGLHTTSNGILALDKISRLVANAWNTVDTDDKAAAMQLALWTLVNEGTPAFSYSPTSGNASAIAGFLTGYLTTANDTTLSGKMLVYTPNNGFSSQVLVTFAGGGGNNSQPVPEPFTMGLGLASAGLYVRKRVKAKKAA